MVTRTIAASFGTYAWEAEVPLFVGANGAPTLEDTGTPLLKGGVQRVGRSVCTANRGETISVSAAEAARGDAMGAFEGSPVDSSAGDAPAPTIAVATPKPRGQRRTSK